MESTRMKILFKAKKWMKAGTKSFNIYRSMLIIVIGTHLHLNMHVYREIKIRCTE